jgi:4-hydroxythreonine-4-phosphate dehydrogenase
MTQRLGITLGDPSGIGPEVLATSLGRASARVRRRLVVFGDRGALERAGMRDDGELELVEVSRLRAADVVPGQPSDAGAHAQVAYLEAAVAAARSGAIAGIVTAPISKTQAKRAGFAFPGHTEFLADRLGAERFAMMFAGPRLRVVLATVHEPLARVPELLTPALIADVIALGFDAMRRDFGIDAPRIGVVGLNPHAGEGGMFGREEQRAIEPGIELGRSRCEGGVIAGPLVPDAAFRTALEGRYDLLVAMYHDQGLIPVKVVDFEQSVNCTIGLPIVRTSPDHGTAYDIAGRGIARAEAMTAALRLAVEMVDRRRA